MAVHPKYRNQYQGRIDDLEAEVEHYRVALGDAHHRMSSVAGRLRLSSEPGTPMRRDGDYLADGCDEIRVALDG